MNYEKSFQLSTLVILFFVRTICSYAAQLVYQHEYDAENNCIQTTTPNGEVLQYKYDCLNLLEKIICPNDEFVAYQYDSNGNRKLVKNNFHHIQYSYDALQRLHEIKQDNLFPIKFNYDKAGRLVELVMPDKKGIVYKYDKSGRLASVDGWIEYFYNETGSLKKQKLANGVYYRILL